eukprot:GCRY01000580.1.p1 GENE.GCRY01000580.1~~GCRY01000580.1.p1  ORF type:complete len:275 (-),score=31.92 GCRY01000580.1:72-896(-)
MPFEGKKSWADTAEEQLDELPPTQISGPNEDGIKTVVEYREDEKGVRYKITSKIQCVKKLEQVKKRVLERKNWKKFGAAFASKGPEEGITMVSVEAIPLKLSLIKKIEKREDSSQNKTKNNVITCRVCGGAHFTNKCPFKGRSDFINNKNDLASKRGAKVEPQQEQSDKYVPVFKRQGFAGNAEGFGSGSTYRNEVPAIRVSNLGEDVTDNDVKELFQSFGSIQRVYLGKDKITGNFLGYAFVTFSTQKAGEEAIKRVDGHGYNHMILKCEWAK